MNEETTKEYEKVVKELDDYTRGHQHLEFKYLFSKECIDALSEKELEEIKTIVSKSPCYYVDDVDYDMRRDIYLSIVQTYAIANGYDGNKLLSFVKFHFGEDNRADKCFHEICFRWPEADRSRTNYFDALCYVGDFTIYPDCLMLSAQLKVKYDIDVLRKISSRYQRTSGERPLNAEVYFNEIAWIKTMHKNSDGTDNYSYPKKIHKEIQETHRWLDEADN